MHSKILTIAIPTLNRSTSLQKVLSNISDIVETYVLQADIDVIIYDNASNDDTANVGNTYSSRYDYVKYYQSKYILSFDENIKTFLDISDTKYVWVCNDHSGFVKEYIAQVVDYLKKNPNCSYFFIPQKGSLPLALEIFNNYHNGLTFINTLMNCNIFNREKLLPYYDSHMAEFNNSWLLYLVANIDMVYSTKAEILLIPYETILYGQYSDPSREKNSWSSDWNRYVHIGYSYSRMLQLMSQKHDIDKTFLKKIFRGRGWGMAAVNAYRVLRLKNMKMRFNSDIARTISDFPSYTFLNAICIKTFVSGSKYSVMFVNALLFPIYAMPMVKVMAKRTKRILKKVFNPLALRIGLGPR